MKLNLLVALLFLSGTAMADELANTGGYTLTIFLNRSADQYQANLKKGNARFPLLLCEAGFQAENIFSFFCRSAPGIPTSRSSVDFNIFNVLNPNQDGKLNISGDPSGPFILHCKLNNPQDTRDGAVCR